MTHDEIEQLLLEAFDQPCMEGRGTTVVKGQLTLSQANYSIYLKVELPTKIKALLYPGRERWVKQEVNWAIKRLEHQGLIERIDEDKWRKLSFLEQLARAGSKKQRRKL